MGKKTNNQDTQNTYKDGRPCRVAYSLNNDQPVMCTIISDQPLFYMDCEDIIEDDDILMDEEILALDRDIQELKRKIDAYDKFSKDFSESEAQQLEFFYTNGDDICDTLEDEHMDDGLAFDTLRESRMAQALLQHAEDHDVEIQFSTNVKDALYDKKAGVILINPNIEDVEFYLLCARELRRHWQHRQGVLVDPLSFHPDQAIFIHRAQQADLAVAIVRIAWELQLSGYRSAWERIENSSYEDLGRTLAREAFTDFRTLNDGNASAAVFETWFLSERCKAADKHIIQRMLADYRDTALNTENIGHSVTMDIISRLGSMPFGKNYLAPYANLIMTDPIFTDVRDRSNANFLWFIKFEKSFRETEHDLQDDGSNPYPGIRSGVLTNRQDAYHETNIVLDFAEYRHSTPSKISKRRSSEPNDNVVYVQFC